MQAGQPCVLKQLPPIEEPSREFVHSRCGQVGQQLREIPLRVHIVAATGTGQAGQHRRTRPTASPARSQSPAVEKCLPSCIKAGNQRTCSLRCKLPAPAWPCPCRSPSPAWPPFSSAGYCRCSRRPDRHISCAHDGCARSSRVVTPPASFRPRRSRCARRRSTDIHVRSLSVHRHAW